MSKKKLLTWKSTLGPKATQRCESMYPPIHTIHQSCCFQSQKILRIRLSFFFDEQHPTHAIDGQASQLCASGIEIRCTCFRFGNRANAKQPMRAKFSKASVAMAAGE